MWRSDPADRRARIITENHHARLRKELSSKEWPDPFAEDSDDLESMNLSSSMTGRGRMERQRELSYGA